jgi:S1-C subfamily serine protease
MVAGVVFLVLVCAPATLFAYAAELECEGGRAPIGYLGISGLSCNCTVASGTDSRPPYWYFRSEPEILNVDPRGPAAGILEPGDIIVAIDGALITTHKAGRHFANTTPKKAVELTLRRKSRIIRRSVVATAICPEDPRMAGAPQAPDLLEMPPLLDAPSVDALGKSLELLAHVPEALEPPVEISTRGPGPTGWLGIGLSCSDCTILLVSDDEVEWHFGVPPTVHSVDPGSPAELAGLEPGDVLTHIDGVPIDSDEGGERFFMIGPEQTITWTVRRGDEEHNLEMITKVRSILTDPRTPRTPRVPGTVRTPRTPRVPVTPRTPRIETPHRLDNERLKLRLKQKLRYLGTLGPTRIEVRGRQSVRIEVDESTGQIIIHTRDATIRLSDTEEEK